MSPRHPSDAADRTGGPPGAPTRARRRRPAAPTTARGLDVLASRSRG